MKDLYENLFPEYPTAPPDHQFSDEDACPTAPPSAVEEVLIAIPGAIVNLIDKHYSVELAVDDFTIFRLVQGDDKVAVLVRAGNEIQWPLAKSEGVVKLDASHYFFSLYSLDDEVSGDDSGKVSGKDADSFLSYGLTIASKGQEDLVKQLDEILESYCSFSVEKVSEKAKKEGEALDGSIALQTSPGELASEKKKKEMCSRRLTLLLQKDVPFEFDEKCKEAFETLKTLLTSAPIIQPPDWSLPFELMCDASDYAIGAVLGQRKDKKLQAIYYALRTMNDAQLNYSTTEKELLAVVFELEKIWSYLSLLEKIPWTTVLSRCLKGSKTDVQIGAV